MSGRILLHMAGITCTVLLWVMARPPNRSPYPPSELISGITFDFSTHRRLAPGSDNWPMTWAEDGRQYAAWGDGGGFGGTNEDGRVSNGFACVEGSADSYTGRNLAGGKSALRAAPFTGKCYGMLSVRGVLYAWRNGAGSGLANYEFQELWVSRDHGLSWAATGVRFASRDFKPPDLGLDAPAFVQRGKDHALADDGYVYAYAPNIKSDKATLHVPGELTLMRAPENRLVELAAWEFFTGLDGAGRPRWTHDVASRQPAWQDRDGGVGTVSAAWHPRLRRYLIITEHTESHRGNIGIYEAPKPWGPWRTVHRELRWGAGHIEPTTFYWNFAPAWWSKDGAGFTLVFTGTGVNDSWNTVRGRLLLRRR